MKKTFLTLVSLLLVASLFSCGASYKDDVPLSVISAALEAKISHASNLVDADEDYIYYFLELDSSKLSEYTVRIPSGSASIDEYGLFHVKESADKDAVLAQLEAYIENRRVTWDTRYDQSEADKVKNAKVTVFGNYLLYTILSDAEAGEVIAAFKEQVEK